MLNYITPDEAVKAVKSGDHIHISNAAQLPYFLLLALERRADAGEIIDILSTIPIPTDLYRLMC